MKTRILITGIGLLVFGLANFFRYLPISHSPTFWNQPFPFEHLQVILKNDGGKTLQIGYLPIDEAINDPYWLFWSLTLYAGIIVIGFVIWSKKNE
jgi:hypothetical protein